MQDDVYKSDDANDLSYIGISEKYYAVLFVNMWIMEVAKDMMSSSFLAVKSRTIYIRYVKSGKLLL